MSGLAAQMRDALLAALPQAQVELRTNPGPAAQDSLLVAGQDLVAVCRVLRDQLDFDLLSNVTGVDWPDPALADQVAVPAAGGETGETVADDGGPGDGGEGVLGEAPESPAPAQGFLEVVYHLYSTTKRRGPLVLRARTGNRGELAHLPSVVSVYRSAEFQEREIFDLYGVRFAGHPDLRRILMWDEFEDHPMRRDYEAPDDYEYEPTPHDAVLEKAKRHHSRES